MSSEFTVERVDKHFAKMGGERWWVASRIADGSAKPSWGSDEDTLFAIEAMHGAWPAASAEIHRGRAATKRMADAMSLRQASGEVPIDKVADAVVLMAKRCTELERLFRVYRELREGQSGVAVRMAELDMGLRRLEL